MSSPSVSPERRHVRPAPESPQNPPEDESSLAADERAYEALEAQESEEAFLEEAEDAPTTTVAVSDGSQAGGASSSVAARPKDEITVQLEKILEDGLGEYVAAMPEEARTRFLYKGQETAGKLSVMVHGVKIQAKKVIELIRDWLLTIPGVNKFFLEQEAKIKTDRVLELERIYREKKQNQP